MTTTQMVAALDAEIRRLRQVRELLAGAAQQAEKGTAKTRHRESTPAAGEGAKRKRMLSPEARERIAAAQRARWAAAKSTSGAAKAGRGAKAGAKRAGRNAGAETAEGAEGTA